MKTRSYLAIEAGIKSGRTIADALDGNHLTLTKISQILVEKFSTLKSFAT